MDLSSKILEMLKRDIDNTKSIKDKTKIKFSLSNHVDEYIKLINNS